MNIFYVYIYKDPTTKIPFYIGKGYNQRAYKHLKDSYTSTHNKHLYNKIQKIKREQQILPIIEIVKSGLTEDEAYDYEEQLIKHYGRIGYEENGILTNKSLTGRAPSGYKWNQTQIDKLIKQRIQNKRKMPDSTREALSKANIGRKMSKDSIKRSMQTQKQKRNYKIMLPNKDIVETNDLTQFMLDHGLNRGAGLLNSINFGKPCEKGLSKGFWLLEITHLGKKTNPE